MEDLVVPVYLNQRIVFDCLAIIEDGFSTFHSLKTVSAERDERATEYGGGLGVSNVFGLLGVSLGASRSRTGQKTTDVAKEEQRIHTPTSLFARLRQHLMVNEQLQACADAQSCSALKPGDFVEFSAALSPNPLIGAISALAQVMDFAGLVTAAEHKRPSTTGRSGSSVAKSGSDDKGFKEAKRLMKAMQDALGGQDTVYILGHIEPAEQLTVVLSAAPEFFGEKSFEATPSGDFRVLGKVTRLLRAGGAESINLLKGTPFGSLDKAFLEQAFSGFESVEQAGIQLPSLRFSVEGPAMEVLPVAIYV